MIFRIQYFHVPVKNLSWARRRGKMLHRKVSRSLNFSFAHAGIGFLDISVCNLGSSMTCAELSLPDELNEHEVRKFLNYMNEKEFNTFLVENLTIIPSEGIIQPCHADND